MDFAFNDEQRALRDRIISFAQRELNDDILARDRAGLFPRELWQKCGEFGLQGLPVAKDYGGSGLGPLDTAIALEALGYGCRDGGLVFAICAHILACVVPLYRHGSAEQKRRYLPSLSDGTLVAMNAITEPAAGSDAFSMSMRAIPDGDGYRITGTKRFISNAPVADLALVYALTDPNLGFHGGVSAFLVETGIPGFSVSKAVDKMGLRTCEMGELVLNDVRVPSDALLGSPGRGAAIISESMAWERICLVASHVGVMEWLLEQAINYARTRKQFGQTIGKFQAVAHPIADMKVRLEAARLLTYRAAWRLGTAREANLDASITKLFVSESLVNSALATMQVFGGYGFLVENDIERVLRDAMGSKIYSGTSEMQRNIIARWLGL
jgi:hypothetical protein